MIDALTGNREPIPGSLEVIRNFAEIHVNRASTLNCDDKGVLAVVLKGPARHRDVFDVAPRPCRHHEIKGSHGTLSLSENNPSRGDRRIITTESIHVSAGRAL